MTETFTTSQPISSEKAVLSTLEPFSAGREHLSQLGVEVMMVPVEDFFKGLPGLHQAGDVWYAACPAGVYRSNLVNTYLLENGFSNLRKKNTSPNANSSRNGQDLYDLAEWIADGTVSNGFASPKNISGSFNKLILCLTNAQGAAQKVANNQLRLLSGYLQPLRDDLHGFQIYLVLGNERDFENAIRPRQHNS